MSKNLAEEYDALVIGCGMAGLAAGIRLLLGGKSCIIVEKHNAPGGLNSFYSLEGRKFDVGLHAVTNFVRPGIKGRPLVKLLRQLRIPREAFALCEQYQSRVAFPGVDLRFNNDFELLESEVARAFPHQIDAFRALTQAVQEFDELNLTNQARSAREEVRRFISDPVLEDMLFCPLMYYGSAREFDMDWDQFVIMFKSIFMEGFARPYEGVRQIIRTLLDKYRSLGGKRKMKCGVKQLYTHGGRVAEVELEDGTRLKAKRILSSMGLVETLRICDDQPADVQADNIGRLSFVETITVMNTSPREIGWDETIVFFNDAERFRYAQAQDLVDLSSGVICLPNNYHYEEERDLEEGFLRITAMANYAQWCALPEDEYIIQKAAWYARLQEQALSFLPPAEGFRLVDHTRFVDMFTPRTVEKYTRHLGGAIYGAPHKVKDGRTHLDNLFICGTDQGFLGIIGAMLSGISMANLHVLSER